LDVACTKLGCRCGVLTSFLKFLMASKGPASDGDSSKKELDI